MSLLNDTERLTRQIQPTRKLAADLRRYDLGIMQKLKLIGSKMENDFREELIQSHDYHFSANSTSRLKEVLESKEIDVSNAYIIGWTPDQTDDLFLVLIGGSWILRVELERYDETVEPVIDRIEIKDYMYGLSRMNQVKLLVAQDLSKS